MGTLEDFRELFWTAFKSAKGRRSKRYEEVWKDLELISDQLAGPLHSIYERGECDYVFTDRIRFPTVRNPENFLTWCLSSPNAYREGVLKAGVRDEDERADQAFLLEQANAMERLSRMAYEIVRARWDRQRAKSK